MKKTLILAAIAALVFGSCASEEVIDPTVLEGQAIDFGTFLDRAPQASQSGSGIKPLGAVLGLPELKNLPNGFTVLAYYTVLADWSAYTKPATPNFMDDQAVTWNSSSNVWEYDPIKFWPRYGNNEWGKVSFFGYSTVNGASADGKANSAPVIGFTTQTAAASQVDLVADADIDITRTTDDGKVNFEFDHILSRIGFSAKLADAYASATVTVTSLKVYYKTNQVVSTGTYTFSASNNKDAANWSLGTTYFTQASSGSGDEVITSSTTLTVNKQALNATDKYLMLIPQSGIDAGDVYVELKYTVTTASPTLTVTNTATINLPAAPESSSAWSPGKAYTYTFSLTLDPVVFDTDIDVNSWEDGSSIGDITLP